MTTEQTPSVEEDHVIRLKARKKKIVNGPPFDLSYPQILNVFAFIYAFYFLPGISARLNGRVGINSEFGCFSLTSSSLLTSAAGSDQLNNILI